MPLFNLPFGFFRDDAPQQQAGQNAAAQGAAQAQQAAIANQPAGGFIRAQGQQMAQGYAGGGGWGQINAMPMGYAQRRVDSFGAILEFTNEWLRGGLIFSEIVVPKHTFHKLYHELGAVAFYQADRMMQPEIPKIPKEFIYNTAMGRIKIVCEEDRAPVFNLDKYMETVE